MEEKFAWKMAFRMGWVAVGEFGKARRPALIDGGAIDWFALVGTWDKGGGAGRVADQPIDWLRRADNGLPLVPLVSGKKEREDRMEVQDPPCLVILVLPPSPPLLPATLSPSP